MNYYYITGSSKGLGLALVKLLLQKQNTYVIGMSRSNDISHDRFEHKKIDFADITNFSLEVDDILQVKEDAKSVTLINNAGTLGEIGYMGELDSKDLAEIYNVNLIAPALLLNAFIKKTKSVTAATFIANISSGAGSYPVDGWSGYCATKAGVNMLSEVISKEQGIRKSTMKIYSIAPGVIDTEMQGQIRKAGDEQFSGVEKFINMKESNALASAEEAADKVLKILENHGKHKEVMQDVRDI